ncbi:MAG: hypothetical protein CUN53_15925 [Phototrophicales bacterium]|nr:MAG: hypothetical protein CUN53_15925 [Phototrophicales bacterium]
MADKNFRSFREYHAYLRSIVSQATLTKLSFAIRVEESGKKSTAEIFVDGSRFVFDDGAALRCYELVRIENGVIIRDRYAYHYQRPDGFYFRYDNDPLRAQPNVHECLHLHVNAESPRFPTHETDFEQIFQFILAVYYP